MKKFYLTLILFLFYLYRPYAQAISEAHNLQGGLRPERTCFDVIFYNLNLKIIVEKKSIKGYNEIHFKALEPTKKIQLDLYRNLKIDSIIFNNNKLSFKRNYNAFFINFPNPLLKDSIYNIRVYYHGKPVIGTGPRLDEAFHWNTYNDKPLVGVSCEIIGASSWYPNKDHLSDEPDSARLVWTLPKGLKCISNGRLINVQVDSIDTTYNKWTWFVKNPINNYNITLYLGDYKAFNIGLRGKDSTQKNIECYYFSVDQQTAIEYFSEGVKFISFCEEKFGEYAFWDDKFAIVQTAYAGMEHQGCLAVGSEINNFKSKYYWPARSTLIHEIAHEWWGNAVSVSDMADMWLHEGLATYTELLYAEYLYGKKVYNTMANNLANTPGGILGKRGIFDNEVFGINKIYWGGAYFLHLLRKEINNDQKFFDILKTYYKRYTKKTVLTEDFIKVVNEKTGKNMEEFFWKNLK